VTAPLAYWPCGGEVIAAGGMALTLADIEAVQGLHLVEGRAAKAAGDHRAATRAGRLALELERAAEAAARWRRAARAGHRLQIIFP
jgi:hypothetical protein